MAEIKRVNVYMGIVGQAYVDKETALSNLNAAIKNVHDMEDIIASAQEQQPVAQTALENAVAAQNLAQSTYNQLLRKFNSQYTNDSLYVKLNTILNDLNINDNDNNSYNGGSTKTAQENVNDINAQITELTAIITEANALLDSRRAFVDELQVVYDNALEKFKSYLPEEEGYDWDAFDREEELLRARIQAVIDALADANTITEAINITSKDVIVRAVDAILAVCYANRDKINNIEASENQYVNEYNNILNQLNALLAEMNGYSYVPEVAILINNANNDITSINGLVNDLSTVRIPNIHNLNTDTNNQIIETWEALRNAINNNEFNINNFNVDVNAIYYIGEQIAEHEQFLTEVKNNVQSFTNSLNNYTSEFQRIVQQETSENWPDTVERDGITYYKENTGAPADGYDLYVIDYNGRSYYAWVANENWQNAPDTIIIDGVIYSKRYTEAPGENHTLLEVTDANGVKYYAWKYNGDPEPQPQPIDPEPQVQEGYYWYAGQDHPSTNNTIVTDNVAPGWRYTGATIDADYEFNTTDNNITDNPTRRDEWYVALPVNTAYYIWDDAHTEKLNSYYVTNETVTFANVSYTVYKLSGTTARALGGILIKK